MSRDDRDAVRPAVAVPPAGDHRERRPCRGCPQERSVPAFLAMLAVALLPAMIGLAAIIGAFMAGLIAAETEVAAGRS